MPHSLIRRLILLPLIFGIPFGTHAAGKESQLSWQIEIAGDPSQSLVRQTRLSDAAKGLSARGVQNQFVSGKLTASGSHSATELQQLLFSKGSNRMEFLDSPTDIDVDVPKDNQGVVLDLQYNPSTGYQWDIADKGVNNIAVSEEASDTPSWTVGAPAIRHLRIKAKNSLGAARLSYRRPFESSPLKTKLSLKVTNAGSDGVIRLVDPEIAAVAGTSTSPNAGATGGVTPLPGSSLSVRALSAVPSSYDARALNLIPNTIRDQKACGSCWAFATVGVQEVAVIKAGLQSSSTVDLSEQFLVSCNKEGYSCNGGWWAHHYHVGTLANSQSFIGAVKESDLAYTASNSACQSVQNHPIRSGSWGSVAAVANSIGATADIQNAIMTYGAVATSVCVDNGWYSYGATSGVYSPTTNACNGSVNHAVLLVGWDDATQSWLLRNSWGPGWGNNGYMQIKYDPNGQNSRVGFASTWVTAAANTLSVSVAGSGSVTSSPSGISCTTNCNTSFAPGTSVSLTATPTSGAQFTGWSGGCSGTTNPCSVNLANPALVTANFSLPSFALTVSKSGNGTVTSSPAGIDCGVTCSATFSSGTTINLTAAPATGYLFSGWSGCTSSSGTSCSVTLNAATAVVATFAPTTSLLSVSPSGNGTVTSSPAGINCGATCSASFATGSTVTLTAAPVSGYSVSGWSGCTSSSGTSCTVNLTAAKTVAVTYAPSAYGLTVTKTGSGAVTSSPAGIDCGATCSASFTNGSSVTLTATPAAGYVFSSWTGCTSASGTNCSVTMSAAKAVVANFAPATSLLTVSPSGNGNLTSTPAGINCGTQCSASFATGSTVTLTATPVAGFAVTGWTGCTSSSGTSCTVNLSAAKSVSVTYAATTSNYVLNVSTSGNGSVSSSPLGINCGTTCQFGFNAGTTVTLTATAGARTRFRGWSGACSGTGSCNVTMNAAKTVSAIFR